MTTSFERNVFLLLSALQSASNVAKIFRIRMSIRRLRIPVGKENSCCTKELQRSNQGFPETLAICRETDVPVRTVKRRIQFRRGMLKHIRDALKPLHNMILFKCNECKSRYPTWHPDFPCPLTKLRCLDACPIDVAPEDFDRKPEGENRFATFHTGICLRCRQSLEKVKDDAVLQGVSAFSARNNMDFVDGMDDENLAPDAAQSSLWDPLLVPDENRLRKEFYYLFENATVVEEMLVALNHMQVDVCYLRRTGLTGFRKNIISFPQDAVELKNFQTFWSNLKIGDIVNVLVGKGPPRRAVIRSLFPESLEVEYPEDHSLETVTLLHIRQRLLLPWNPRDLRDNLILFRRRDARKDDYVENLRVRRNLIKRLLTFFSMKGTWRQDQGTETLHKYYASCDWLNESEIDELLPEDDIPDGLHFQDKELDEEDDGNMLSRAHFREWLSEGKMNCDVAQVLLNFWLEDRAQSKHCDTIDDFFSSLVQQKCEEEKLTAAAVETDDTLTFQWLATFVASNCILPYAATGECVENLIPDLVQRIRDEVIGVQAYINVWRASGTIEKQAPENVIRKTQDLVKEVIHPWPTIQEDPTPWSDDARFAKAFPLSFPMGTGDYRQPRLRSDFNALDWTQHVFRFYTGHMQSSMRGHRVLWAAFNMTLGDIASGKR